jgi:DNA primase
VAGRISEADRERVREASRIDSVIGEYVALKRAGSGNLKGLCPFHDEKTPSFNVSVARGYYHCFGCGEGGDVFDFLMKIDQLSYVEAVQHLADAAGITISLVEGGTSTRSDRGSRSRLVAVTKAAAAFYADRLGGDEAAPARAYLTERGFDADAAVQFGCGFAPSGWDSLVKHLLGKGFSVEEMIAAGVAKRGQRGPIDAFHRRLLWSIRDAAGDVVGFGARRLFDDDRIEAKYVNTSGQGRLYRKSQVLYGLNLAKRDIVRQRQVVVVEGYTDVMAMHLAGVTTAVAACGTAFGEGHIEVLRRYLMDSELIRGEVIYVFDGDAAGQKAALKAFDSDQKFAANTFVAIAPGGMDPCELRQDRGDAALRDLVRSRTPLFRFAITNTLDSFDLETVEGRTAALTAAAPMVARIKDETARDGYVRELADRVGVDPSRVAVRVRDERRALGRSARRGAQRPHADGRPSSPSPPDGREARNRTGPAGGSDGGTVRSRRGGDEGGRTAGGDTGHSADAGGDERNGDGRVGDGSANQRPYRRPNPGDPATVVERETLKLVLQFPGLVAPAYPQVQGGAFTDPAYAALHTAVTAAGGPAAGSGATWVASVSDNLPAGPLRSLVTELAVEPLRHRSEEPEPRYAGAILARMAERVAVAQERDLASALRRAEAAGDRERAASLNADLNRVMAYRRALSDRARGAE